ncbi:ImuA family protein [Dyadobacter psychrotolerans]|uniref:Error-prone repair protein ImuA n=1 Tax=Dyadobacter psychrotolerans TaxID=2541721 RepID=A0A4R5DSH3_9BACT|nr:Error-prone repair protein ImuA [Dyadobacter psychrotolerans]TDE17382.1 Error-prone repair protein ImuA [Dyadobacter psychrotolerans]
MEHPTTKIEILEKLRRDVISLQGLVSPSDLPRIHFGLGQIEASFPNHAFPVGAIHEFISTDPKDGAATTGFMSGLLGKLMQNGGKCLWISTKRTIFPPALKIFGLEPDKIIFIDLNHEKDKLWVIEEALKCKSLAAVVGEIREISFTESRRLQLAVERSRVTGFLHRNNPRTINTLACVSRWKIKSIPSKLEDGMPGVGFPSWQVDLLKIRNGEPGSWEIVWEAGEFKVVREQNVSEIKLRLLRAV